MALLSLREAWPLPYHVSGLGPCRIPPTLPATLRKGISIRLPPEDKAGASPQGSVFRRDVRVLTSMWATAYVRPAYPIPGIWIGRACFALASVAAEDVAQYARMVAYHPARADSLLALTACPAEIRGLSGARRAQAWARSLALPATIPFGETGNPRHRGQGRKMDDTPEEAGLRSIGGRWASRWNLTRRMGAESLEDDTPVHVFACPNGSMSRGAEGRADCGRPS